jgi:predicted SnoaL-like aldol condensation-catalyzing enzyme
MSDNKQVVRATVASIYEHRDPAGVRQVFDPAFRQHGTLAADGVEGLQGFIAALGEDTGVTLHRVLAEGDLVVTHGSYSGLGDGPLVGFELWRLRDGLITEHWDGFEPRVAETASGRSQTDGPTTATPADRARTAANRAFIEEVVQTILVENDFSNLDHYLAGEAYAQHNHRFGDGISGLAAALQALAEQGITMKYTARHHTVAEGDFVYTLAEGRFGNDAFAFHDLFRVADGRAAEHWDVMIPEPAVAHGNGLY